MVKESFNFGADFQDLIIACYIANPEAFICYGPILEPKYFSGVNAVWAMESILTYAERFSEIPNWEVLGNMMTSKAKKTLNDENVGDRIEEYIKHLKELDTRHFEYVAQQVVAFCKERAILTAIKKSVEEIKEGTIDGSALIPRFEEALQVGTNLDSLGYLLHRDAPDVVRKITSTTYGIRTGFPHLDDIWKNGWGPGWLISFLAPPKRFKTTMCLNLALNMVSPAIAGDVIYYTCEIAQELALARALCAVSGLTLDDMYRSPEEFIGLVQGAIGMQIAGNLLIKGYASKTVRISDIDAHLQTVRTQYGFRPKAVIIDYAENIAYSSSVKSMPPEQQQASVFTEARAMGQRRGCCVIMPDRCNKETVNRPVPDMTSFQGSFQKSGIVDAAIGLCGTDAEIINGILRWFVFLNRHGPAFQHFQGKVDAERYRLEIEQEIDYDPEAEQKNRKRKDAGPADHLPPELQE